MSLCSIPNLESLHYLIRGLKEAKYNLSWIVGTIYYLFRKFLPEKKIVRVSFDKL